MLLPSLTIFFISCALLSYEILLMRILSIVNWGHYAYMAVSLAMLGLGFSGVLLAFGSRFFKRFRNRLVLAGCFLFSVSLPLCTYLSHRIPVNYLYLIWDGKQFFYLTAQFFIYGLPFLIASTTLALFFTSFKKYPGRVYAFNLAGSGTGVFIALLTMHLLAPGKYLAVTGIFSVIAGASWAIYILPRKSKTAVVSLSALLILFLPILFPSGALLQQMSEYKGLNGLLRLPGTEITGSFYSPLGLIHTLKGERIRLAPGLSLNFTGEIPQQKAITFDGETAVPVYSFTGSFEELRFLDHTVYAAGYSLCKNPSVLIIGAGGGGDALLAGYHRSKAVNVLEIDPKVIQAVEEITEPPAISPFNLPYVDANIKEARGYLGGTKERFDLIFLNPSGSMSTSASGVYAQNEDYLNTTESYALTYNRLSANGIFSVSRWIKTPPRDGIKLFATAFNALKKAGVQNPGEHLALIRNWDIITILIKKSPFTAEEIARLYTFCSKRSFDISYLPGLDKNVLNRFHILPEETYYQAAESIIQDTEKREEFFKGYLFNVVPADDNRPYFSNFFRWRAVPHLIRTMRKEWMPFAEFGYITLFVTFIQALVFGFLLIILPLTIKTRKDRNGNRTGLKIYFCLLGFSYMTLEISLIQKFILFLHHPIYSASIVIASFLLVSGIGSYTSGRFEKRYRLLPFAVILFFGFLYILFLDSIFSALGWSSTTQRIILSFLIISPLAFFMGIPFPSGIKKILDTGERGVGTAWGYNGFFSVAGAVTTPILSNLLGFRMVGIIGCAGYLAAMLLWYRVKH
jgi:hypothetical protein